MHFPHGSKADYSSSHWVFVPTHHHCIRPRTRHRHRPRHQQPLGMEKHGLKQIESTVFNTT